MAAESAAVGPQDPVDRLLHRVANAYASKINRFAVRTTRGEHSFCGLFLTVSFRRTAGTLDMLFRNAGVEFRTLLSCCYRLGWRGWLLWQP